jgi:hypothetical protein
MRKPYAISLAVVGAFLVACGSGGSHNSSTKPAGTVAAGAAGGASAKAGQPIRDGKFEFTVEKMKCGVTRVGSGVLNQKAQGQYCLVTLKVKNIGKEAQTFDDSDQKAYGSDGAQFAADSTADLYVNRNDETFLNDVNPGNFVTGTVAFDIPKTAKLARLELHDSPFSDGVTVAVA